MFTLFIFELTACFFWISVCDNKMISLDINQNKAAVLKDEEDLMTPVIEELTTPLVDSKGFVTDITNPGNAELGNTGKVCVSGEDNDLTPTMEQIPYASIQVRLSFGRFNHPYTIALFES